MKYYDILFAKQLAKKEYTAKRYTVRWDMVNAQCTRLNDAADITVDTTNFGHFGAVNGSYYNPFDYIYPWSGRKLCNIDLDLYRALGSGADLKNCVVAWEGDVTFSYDHQYGVWVYTPKFYGKSEIIGNYRYFDVSNQPFDGCLTYEASIVGRWLGADVVLTIDGTSKHCNLPKTGMPMANVTMANQHTYAKNYGATLNDIYAIDAVSLLFIVEYASMNLQTKLGSGVSNLYRTGIHPAEAVTDSNTLTIAATDAAFIPGAIVYIGTSNEGMQIARTYVTDVEVSGSSTILTLADAVTCTTDHIVSILGLITVADDSIGSKSGYIGTNGKANAYYRGQTFFANKYQYILGAYRQTGSGEVWIAEKGDSDNYDALDTSKHIDTGVALTETSGYIQTLGVCDELSFAPFCTEVGGSSANPVGDYCYVPALTAGNTVLLLGGGASHGTYCGWYGYWNNTAGTSYWSIGSCPLLKTP